MEQIITSLLDNDLYKVNMGQVLLNQYSDADGKLHNVLVIKNGLDGQMYKTEVSAFIEKFLKYDAIF